jgi:alkanesulfonate monooxygenase SsuD/methylene tetrahydromethanopterin reductase-like flavin-dependent oxidoreductase (luciferase family)
MILPPTTQGELAASGGSTLSTTDGASALSELCRRVEASGADSLWAVDHLFWPHPINEPLTTLAVASVATTRPLLGTCVLQLPLRRSAAIAKQATALQLLSGGRFVLGVGVGIHEGEYARAGTDYHRRGRLMDEGLAELRASWEDVDGSDYVMEPASSPVPVWFGGSSDSARRRAAAVGDGWVPLFLSPDDYASALDRLRRDTEEAGRDPDSVAAAVVVFACVGDDGAAGRGAEWLSSMYRLPPKAFHRHLAAGSPEACADRFRLYAEAGAQHIVVMVAGSPAVEQFRQLRAAFAPEECRVLAGSTA